MAMRNFLPEWFVTEAEAIRWLETEGFRETGDLWTHFDGRRARIADGRYGFVLVFSHI
jgi:hypothetical protein